MADEKRENVTVTLEVHDPNRAKVSGGKLTADLKIHLEMDARCKISTIRADDLIQALDRIAPQDYAVVYKVWWDGDPHEDILKTAEERHDCSQCNMAWSGKEEDIGREISLAARAVHEIDAKLTEGKMRALFGGEAPEGEDGLAKVLGEMLGHPVIRLDRDD